MSKSKKDRNDIVEVEIYDQRYPLRLKTSAERAEIQQIAKEVDQRMREIAHQTATVDSLKVAVLTALHLAGENRAQDAGGKRLKAAVRSGAKKWIAEIDKAL